MRVPAKSTHHNNQQPQNPKPVSCNNNTNANLTNVSRNIIFRTHTNGSSTTCYEPTSVLDPRRSPSPVTEKQATTATEVPAAINSEPPPVEWEEHSLRNIDWDSIMKELGLDDDSVHPIKTTTTTPQFITRCEPQIIQHHLTEFTPCQQLDSTQFLPSDFNFNFPDVTQNQNHNSFDFSNNFHNVSANSNVVRFDFIEELLRAADCFDTNELAAAQMILSRLNQRLRSPVGKPIQRAGFYFKEALSSILTGSTRPSHHSSWSEIVQSIKAFKAFSGISPIPMFSHFTSNQALLESMEGSPPLIHIIDFDIGYGGQYASFMREIAEKAVACNKLMNPTSLRITAVVTDEYVPETKLIKDILFHFAQELKIRFHIDFVLVRAFGMLSFKAVKFMEGERIAVVLSPTIFRRLGSTNNAIRFVTDMRELSPSVVVFVDNEGWQESGPTASFRKNFVNSLEYYAMVFESLDAAIGCGEWARKIEMFLLRARILAAVEGAGSRMASWRDVFNGAGMRAVRMSQFADFQAECLLEKVQVAGFRVVKRQDELVLCWHQCFLVATSAWR